MADNYKPLGFGGDYSRLLQCIDDLRALILPVVEAQEAKKAETPPVVVPQDAQQGVTMPVGEPQETRPSKRTRTGLSAFTYDKNAFELFKEKKRREIHEFQMNYQGPPYNPVDGFCGARYAETMIVPWDTKLLATKLARSAKRTRWRPG
jgi:hypothetical protein